MFGRILLTLAIWIFGVAISVGYLISQLTYTVYRQMEITPAVEASIAQFLEQMSQNAQRAIEAGNQSYYPLFNYAPSLQGFLTYPETTFAPWYFQLGVFALCALIVIAGIISTVSIWQHAPGTRQTRASRDADRDVAPLGRLLRENDRQRVRVTDEAANAAKRKRDPQPVHAAEAYNESSRDYARLDRLQDLMHEFARGTLDLNTLSPDERVLLQETLENQFTREQLGRAY